MSLNEKIGISLALLPVSYYATTLCLWFGHWFSHQPNSPLRDHHLQSHHRLYPNSRRCRAPKFRCAKGKFDSNKALFPWLLIPLCMEGVLLPSWLAVAGMFQVALMTAIVAWVHVQFHLEHSVLDGRVWFARARARHEIHHDQDKNFAVGDHFWDRLFGTFADAGTVMQLSSRVNHPRAPQSQSSPTPEQKAFAQPKPCRCGSCRLACCCRHSHNKAAESLHSPTYSPFVKSPAGPQATDSATSSHPSITTHKTKKGV
ncbi:MAG TPA: sterol desaturase family protein [Verrucomicrobiae bacterium]|nr:sterol desaturase family protein [Verrucomicrobiae bacterium]